ncbi:MAG: HAD family phosphatase [Planctomycetota bacterium]|nr:HAD family phosphatase [Planctomycetota bacterium]
MLRAVAFDMDGLMFNTEDVYSAVGTELMRRRGREFCSGLKDAMMGLPPQATFEEMIRWHSLDDDWEELAAESDKLYVEYLDDHLAPMPGLLDLLEALEAAGIPKAVATSPSSYLAETTLSRFEMASRFEFILTSESITNGKPAPEIYLQAAERFGLPATEMLVLEDSINGCRAGVGAGAFVVAIPNEHTCHQDFSIATETVEDLTSAKIYSALGLNNM